MFRSGSGWALRVDVGFAGVAGIRRQMLRHGFATKKAAEVALARFVTDGAKGPVVSRSTMRVEGFLADWLETARSKLRPTTHYSYRIAAGRMIAMLGRQQLQSLTPMQIERFYAGELAGGGRLGGPLSPKTVRNTHTVLRKALADAERLGLVHRNAAAAARPPAAVRPDLVTWSSEDLRSFLSAVGNDRLFAAYVLLATTGMRRGEVLETRSSARSRTGSATSLASRSRYARLRSASLAKIRGRPRAGDRVFDPLSGAAAARRDAARVTRASVPSATP